MRPRGRARGGATTAWGLISDVARPHRELRAGAHLPMDPRQLAIELDRPGVHADADRPAGRRPDRIVAGVEPVVQPVHQVREADRVDVEYGCGLGVGAHLGWIAGD